MKKALILAILALHFGSFAQKKDFIEDYVYTAGDRDSKDDCYNIAKTHLRNKLLDKVGVYVRNETTLTNSESNGKFVQNFNENISTISAAITEFRVIEQKWDGIKYWMKAMITVDTTFLRQLVVNIQNTSELDVIKKEIEQMKIMLEQVRGSKIEPVQQNPSNKLFAKQILKAGSDEQFISLKHSKQNRLLFITTTKGKMIVLNENDSIIKTFKFDHLGTVDLDYVGELGSYSDDRNTIYIFNQKTLKIVDTIHNFSNSGQGSTKVWFTKTGIFISTFKNVYRYTQAKEIVIVAPQYTILDYNFTKDQFLVGFWDKSISHDRKIKKLSICDATNFFDREEILTMNRSFEKYSYLVNEGKYVISCDGSENYYKINTVSLIKKITIQDTIKNSSKKTHGLVKINDNTLLVVKYNAIPLNQENIQKYGLTIDDNPTEFIFKRTSDDEIVRSVVLLQSINKNQIVLNDITKTIYYLSSGGTGNKLISIR